MNSRRRGYVFYNDLLGFCQIYQARSVTCSNYKCEDLKEHLLQQERIEKGLQLLEEKENQHDSVAQWIRATAF